MLQRHTRRHRPLYVTNTQKRAGKSTIEWKILPLMWIGFKRLCFVLGAMVFLSMLMGVYTASYISGQQAPSLPDEMVLYLPLEGGLNETPPEASFSEPFAAYQPTVHEIIYAIDKAAGDPRVKGMMARLDNAGLSLVHVQELRAAIKRFKAAGKFTKIYSSSYGDAMGGLGRYYLASAFDEIWMQPLGIVTINGVKAEVPYLRSVLDKVGIFPDFYQREEHKTAYESLTNTQMTPENREMLQGIVDSVRTSILQDVPAERGIDEATFEKMVDQGLFTAQEALDQRLITHMDYADVMVDNLRVEITGDVDSETPLFADVGTYLGAIADEEGRSLSVDSLIHEKPRVALIYTVGAIMESDVNAMGGGGVFMGGGVAASDVIAEAIMEAAEDDMVDTIVLRVDSPGGSPIASERILRALDMAKKKDGKNIVVSMGATAASGGYWVAAHADKIFAMPMTVTGSIGVLGGKFSFGDLSKKLDVRWDGSVQWGQNAGMWSVNAPFSATERERVNAMLDQIYDAFLQRVSEGRKMPVEDVRKIAGGRVWTGVKALDVGLVDELGGLENALDYAATLSGKASSDEVDVVVLPRPKTPLEKILELFGSQGAVFQGYRIQAELLTMLKPLLQDFAIYNSAKTPLTYDPVRID